MPHSDIVIIGDNDKSSPFVLRLTSRNCLLLVVESYDDPADDNADAD